MILVNHDEQQCRNFTVGEMVRNNPHQKVVGGNHQIERTSSSSKRKTVKPVDLDRWGAFFTDRTGIMLTWNMYAKPRWPTLTVRKVQCGSSVGSTCSSLHFHDVEPDGGRPYFLYPQRHEIPSGNQVLVTWTSSPLRLHALLLCHLVDFLGWMG